MTLAEQLRFLADRAEDKKEFYWGDFTMKFVSETLIRKKLNGHWVRSELKINSINYCYVELKQQWEFTEDEKTILRNLPIEYRWIARDKVDNNLYVFNSKPFRINQWWACETGNSIGLSGYRHLFKSIQWSDDEPCEFGRYLWKQ